MPRISSGKRYAQAAFELAQERNTLESWQEGLKRIAEITRDKELMASVENPRLRFEVKKALLQERLGGIPPQVFNLALLLVSKGIFVRAGAISRQYDDLLDAYRGIERAQVTAAVPLSDVERGAISRNLGEIVHRQIILDVQVDPSIIGGFIARIRDTLIDGSIRQRLGALRESLVQSGR
jgi:F-type H+-transporting ATPase subunit delta